MMVPVQKETDQINMTRWRIAHTSRRDNGDWYAEAHSMSVQEWIIAGTPKMPSGYGVGATREEAMVAAMGSVN